MGKPAGKVELAWLHLKDAAPWGWMFFGAFMCVLVLVLLAGAAGVIPTKFGPGGDCGPRGMTLADTCD